MHYTIRHIADIIFAEIIHSGTDQKIEHLLYDSRRAWFPDKALFFTLTGKKREGADFIPELYHKGVRAFVVSDFPPNLDISSFLDATFLKVSDVLSALQLLASHHRSCFPIPVIGLTGSNGKTIVKEWLYHSFFDEQKVVRSPGSFNSQLGVPLSIWQLNSTHTLAIFEAGISRYDEMEKLEKMIKPSLGLLTYMGEAHSEGFTTFEEKIREKLKLFINARQLVYCCDDERVDKEVGSFAASHRNINCYSWGRSEKALFRLMNEEKHLHETVLLIKTDTDQFNIHIPFTDRASTYNAMTCMTVLWLMGMNATSIQEAVKHWKPVSMRLEQRQAIHQCSMINDSYSSDLSSLRTALDYLAQQDAYPKHTVILTDMEETGMESDVWIAKIAEMLGNFKLHRFIGVGPVLCSHQQAFKQLPICHFFENTGTLVEQITSLPFSQEAILIKGSRSFMLEKAVKCLEQKSHDTILEINLNALRHNLSVYRNSIPSEVKLMVMVKAFGYGTGGHEIASVLKQEGADYLAVAFADEGVELRKAGVHLPIMVLNPHPNSFDAIIDYQLEPEIFSFNSLKAWNLYLEDKGISDYPVHIKLDTGMHRLGFMEKDISELAHLLSRQNTMRVRSVFSHLAASEDPGNDAFTGHQTNLFHKMTEELQKILSYSFLKHLSNTSAISRHPQAQFDMVRLGIGLYGIDAMMPLQPVATLKTNIAQIKHLPKGETVGYGRAGLLQRDSVIATVRIGYADGFPRILSNGMGMMMVNGKKVPVIGNVCMDMTMLDITDVSAVEGDEVLVFGKDLSISEVAVSAQTIPYEIITGIAQRVTRIYIQD